MNTDDDVIVPLVILGGALLLYSGFFTAAREWIQARVKAKATDTGTSPPQSRGQGQAPPPGSNPINPGYGGGALA